MQGTQFSGILTSLALVAASAVIGTSSPVQAGDLTIVGWGGTTQAAHKVACFDPFVKDKWR